MRALDHVACMSVDKQISRFLNNVVPDVKDEPRVAVAVSGGGDSMALCFALAGALPDTEIHFITVDHGLRSEAAKEAVLVSEWLEGLGIHTTLKWTHEGVDRKIQEQARDARYRLISEYCDTHEINALFLGHNQDDLIETYLMRLSSGSGLDGLASIAPVSWHKDLMLLRPFYDVPHADLIAYCQENHVEWVEDPSNDSDKYKRVRFRKAQAFMEEEGLTQKRLAKTIERTARAKDALDQVAYSFLDQLIVAQDDETVSIDFIAFQDLHAEFKIRVLSFIIEQLVESAYPPRLEKLEGLAFDITRDAPFRKRTFSGCLFEARPGDNVFVISVEKGRVPTKNS